MSATTLPSVTVQARSKLYSNFGPMVVRVDERLLAQLFDRRQEDAARILVSAQHGGGKCLTGMRQGMSLTSLKMACRRLGIKRWPYSRYEPSFEEILSNSSSQAAASQPSVQQTTSQPENAEAKEAESEGKGKEGVAAEGSEWECCCPPLAHESSGDEWLDWYMGCEMMMEDVSYPITQNFPNEQAAPTQV